VAAEHDAQVHRDAPYRMPGQKLTCFFRHDGLSDAIGFEYSTWHGDDAAAHFAGEVAKLAEHYQHDPNRVLLIALDGENAWEHYPFNGYYFLRGMYAALAADPRLELTTPAGYLARAPQAQPLPRVVSGSWVHGTLATWIGDPAKNAAWDLLCEAKDAFDRVVVEGPLDEAQVTAAERQLALCESSDWFWWFGDYNPSEAVGQFDRLYRRQLANLYRLLKLEPPEALSRPLSAGGGAGSAEHGGTMRRANAG
jgi:alpha-amylase/alpha-mannosidase (GH57 family)